MLDHFTLWIMGSLLFLQSAWAEQKYINQDIKACANLSLKCPSHQHPFYDEKGCGCQTHTETAPSKRYYVNKDRSFCQKLHFKCDVTSTPFFDEQGCGCQLLECKESEKKLLNETLNYQRLQVEDAGISFEIPKNWTALGEDKTEWSPHPSGIPLIGFKAEEIPSEWQPVQMLPQHSQMLGPYTIDLGWEQGLLFFMQLHDTQKKADKFELHIIIPRMEAQFAYDFYASAPTLEQLNSIESVHQRFVHSGVLRSIKRYVNENLEECKDLKLDCNVNEQEFHDEDGCGCMTLPQREEVYDN